MAIDHASDLTEMLSTDDFGTAFTYSSSTYNGIFDAEYVAQNADGTVDLDTTHPVLHYKTSDVSIAHGATVTIGGVNYTVRGVQPDGQGVTMLVLEAQ